MRTFPLALTAFGLAVALAPLAVADESIGISTERVPGLSDVAGVVAWSSESTGGGRSLGSMEAAASCSYTGAPMAPALGGSTRFTFSGVAGGYSTAPHLVEFVGVRCTLISPAQGLPGEQPTLTSRADGECAQAVCTTVGGPVVWPSRPVQICVSGLVLFGPVIRTLKEIPPVCLL